MIDCEKVQSIIGIGSFQHAANRYHLIIGTPLVFIFCSFFGKWFKGHFSRNAELVLTVSTDIHLNLVPLCTRKVCCCLQLSFNLECYWHWEWTKTFINKNQLMLSYTLPQIHKSHSDHRLLYRASHKTSFQCLLCTMLRSIYVAKKSLGLVYLRKFLSSAKIRRK